MAGRFITGFEPYSSAEIPLYFTQGGGTIGPQHGRNGNGCSLGFLGKTLDYQPTWIVGWAYRNMPSPAQNFSNIYFLKANDKVIFSVLIPQDNTCYLQAGQNTFANIPNVEIHDSTWYFFEIKVHIFGDPLQITASMRINGDLWVDSVTANTGVSKGSTLLNLSQANNHVWTSSRDGNSDIDDIYVYDGNGINSDFAGDGTIGAIYAASDNSTQYVGIFPSMPTTHWDKVTEDPPNYDGSYIFDNVVGHEDNFNWSPIGSFVGTIPVVQLSLFARKDAEGYRAISAVVDGSVDSRWFYLNDSYVYRQYPYDLHPGSNAPWTVSLFDSTVFGVKTVL